MAVNMGNWHFSSLMCWERSEPCLCCSTTTVHLEWNSAGQMTFSVMRPDLPAHFYSWIFLTLMCEIHYFFQPLYSLLLINPDRGCPLVFVVLNSFFQGLVDFSFFFSRCLPPCQRTAHHAHNIMYIFAERERVNRFFFCFLFFFNNSFFMNR